MHSLYAPIKKKMVVYVAIPPHNFVYIMTQKTFLTV